jgi:CheY-like chemotaxis protein
MRFQTLTLTKSFILIGPVKARKFTLLIVDDSEADRYLLTRAFRKHTSVYRVQAVSCGREALEYIAGQGQYADRQKYEFPSYIITDLKMPDGDGFEILCRVRSNRALSIIPVIMLSGSADLDDIRQAYEFGASAYFVKPATSEALENLVRKIHDYWSECEVPEVDSHGVAMMTTSEGKASARFKGQKR